MPVNLNFYLTSQTDGFSPAQDTPTVSIWYPMSGVWTAIANPVLIGPGWWQIPANNYAADADSPLLLYAVGRDSYPSWNAYFPDGASWIAGLTSPPLPIWLSTIASGGYQPAAGFGPAIQINPTNGPAFAPAAGTLVEPGGTGNGNGFYVYTPSPAEIPSGVAGDLLLTASAAGAFDFAADYTVSITPNPLPPSGGSTAIGLGFGGPPAFAIQGTYAIYPQRAVTDTITLSDQGAGGTFTPPFLVFDAYGGPISFLYQPVVTGFVTLTVQSAEGYIILPPALTVLVTGLN